MHPNTPFEVEVGAAPQAPIMAFTGEFRFLSNFYLSPFTLDGVTYTSSEAAYQAAKAVDPAQRTEIARAGPSRAKRLGRQCLARADWEDIKVEVMRSVLIGKFLQNTDLCRRLKATMPRCLIEGNTWHDNFWGICQCDFRCFAMLGQNKLGHLLMELRNQL